MDHCARAHHAGFDRAINSRTRQPVILHAPGRLAQRDNLGMSRRIVRSNRLIEAASNDVPAGYDHGSNGNLVNGCRFPRLCESQIHVRAV